MEPAAYNSYMIVEDSEISDESESSDSRIEDFYRPNGDSYEMDVENSKDKEEDSYEPHPATNMLEIVEQIASDKTLNLKDIYHMCQTQSLWNNYICKNPMFWRTKYKRDFGTKLNPKVSITNTDMYVKLLFLDIIKLILTAVEQGLHLLLADGANALMNTILVDFEPYSYIKRFLDLKIRLRDVRYLVIMLVKDLATEDFEYNFDNFLEDKNLLTQIIIRTFNIPKYDLIEFSVLCKTDYYWVNYLCKNPAIWRIRHEVDFGTALDINIEINSVEQYGLVLSKNFPQGVMEVLDIELYKVLKWTFFVDFRMKKGLIYLFIHYGPYDHKVFYMLLEDSIDISSYQGLSVEYEDGKLAVNKYKELYFIPLLKVLNDPEYAEKKITYQIPLEQELLFIRYQSIHFTLIYDGLIEILPISVNENVDEIYVLISSLLRYIYLEKINVGVLIEAISRVEYEEDFDPTYIMENPFVRDQATISFWFDLDDRIVSWIQTLSENK